MQSKTENGRFEDQGQIDALDEFAPRIRELIREYREQRKLTSIARNLGFHPPRLKEMITKGADGKYKKRVTPYYLAKFIDGGFMTVPQILEGRDLEDLPEKSRIFFTRMILPRKTVELVFEAKGPGIDIDRILEEMLYPQDGS